MRSFRDGDVIDYGGRWEHCMDGYAVVSKGAHSNNLLIHDTYWQTDRKRVYPDPKDCKLLFNLSDVRKVELHEFQLYAEEDAFCLSTHHGFRDSYYVKKDAKQSLHHQLKVAKERLEYAKDTARSARHSVYREIENVSRLKHLLELEEKDEVDLTTANADLFDYACRRKDLVSKARYGNELLDTAKKEKKTNSKGGK